MSEEATLTFHILTFNFFRDTEKVRKELIAYMSTQTDNEEMKSLKAQLESLYPQLKATEPVPVPVA